MERGSPSPPSLRRSPAGHALHPGCAFGFEVLVEPQPGHLGLACRTHVGAQLAVPRLLRTQLGARGGTAGWGPPWEGHQAGGLQCGAALLSDRRDGGVWDTSYIELFFIFS